MDADASAGRTIVFAGGGSGGHLSPGLAVAEALSAMDGECTSLFLCSDRSVDAEMLREAGVRYAPVPARAGKSIRALLAAIRARRESRRLLRERRAAVVLSLGGFVALPVAAAARSLGIPVVVLNLDAVIGGANRFIARFATLLLSAVPTESISIPADRIVGLPLRRAALAPGPAAECRGALGLDPSRDTLLVTGASQGSNALNDAVPAILAASPRIGESWQVLHLAGGGDTARLDPIRARYRDAGIRARVDGFVHGMGLAWGAATLAVTRGGANSVAEAEANAVPTIIVPFPHHRDQHQRLNARHLVECGAARLARDPSLPDGVDPPLAEVLPSTLADREFISTACSAMQHRRRPDAAKLVAERLVELARVRD